MIPSIALATIDYRLLIIVLLPTLQTPVSLEIVLRFGWFFLTIDSMVHSISFYFIVQSLVKFTQLLNSIAHTIFQILITLRLFMPFTVYLKQCFVISLDNIYIQVVAFGTLRVEGSPTTLVVAGHSKSNHVPTD